MEIHINPKLDEKLLENYPDDPYSNLSIVTQTRSLNLQLAYLSIDSNFFANIDPDTREVNLTHLHEEPLLRVIRSLYGERLTANSIGELSQLYRVIKQLEIDDYKTNIEKEISSKPSILESLEFLEFSFANNLLVDKVVQTHIQNKLKLLESNRNYLQLNKITLNTFQTLVQKFIQTMTNKYGSIENLLTKPEAQIINHVMENYFNRNNIKAGNHFKQAGNLTDMEMIWSKYHHTFAFNSTQTKQFGASMVNFPSNSSQFLTVKKIQQKARKKSQQIININVKLSPEKPSKSPSISSTSEMEKKRQRVQQLQDQIKQRDTIIAQLEKQIALYKQISEKHTPKPGKRISGGSSNQTVPQVIDEQELMKQSTEESLSFLPNIKKTRKSKDYNEEDDFAASSVFEPAFNNNRRLPEMKQVRTMKKVAGTVKNKFLPN